MADNFRLDVIHDTEAVLKKAVQLAFDLEKRTTAKEWVVKDGWLLIFAYSMDRTQTEKFLAECTPETVAGLCWDWIQETEYPDHPGIDGTCKKGFRLSTASIPNEIPENDKGEQCVIGLWTQPRNERGAIFAIKPVWTMYGR